MPSHSSGDHDCSGRCRARLLRSVPRPRRRGRLRPFGRGRDTFGLHRGATRTNARSARARESQPSAAALGARAQEYSGDLRTASGHNLKDFTAFNARIPEARETKAAISFVRRACGETTRAPQVIRNSVRPVLAKLQANRGVIKALLVTEDSIMQSTGDVDQLAILSNLQSTLNFANLTLAQNLDQCEHISIDSSDSRILMWRIERCIFVVMVSRAVEHALYIGVLEEALVLLQQVVFVLAEVRHNTDARENP